MSSCVWSRRHRHRPAMPRWSSASRCRPSRRWHLRRPTRPRRCRPAARGRGAAMGTPMAMAATASQASGDGIGPSGTATNRNFLVRTLPLWVAQGFAVVILGSPNGAPLLGQRHTPDYLAAIDRVVDFARSRANAPIWLVGTSQGSTAAVNGAAHLDGKIAGVVLTSSVTRPNRSGETVFDSEPGLVAQPALIVANQGDTCRAT